MDCNNSDCHCQNQVNHTEFNQHCTTTEPSYDTNDAGCDTCHDAMEPLMIRKWDCNSPQAEGPVNHNGHIYVNLVDGNTIDPALGVGNGSYAGAFNIVTLMNYLIANA